MDASWDLIPTAFSPNRDHRGRLSMYDVLAYVTGVPGNAQVIARVVLPRAIILAPNFADSRANVGVNPTAPAICLVKKNGVQVGTITIAVDGTAVFASTGGAAVTFAIGDVLAIEAPTVADATMAEVSISLVGTLS